MRIQSARLALVGTISHALSLQAEVDSDVGLEVGAEEMSWMRLTSERTRIGTKELLLVTYSLGNAWVSAKVFAASNRCAREYASTPCYVSVGLSMEDK